MGKIHIVSAVACAICFGGCRLADPKEKDDVAIVDWVFHEIDGKAIITNLVLLDSKHIPCLCIPSVVGNGIPVEKVEVAAGSLSEVHVRRVYVADGIKELPRGFLANNYTVESVSLPGSLVTIPDCFAYLAHNLCDVEFRGAPNVEVVGRYSFYNSGLVDFELPCSVKEIKDGAFGFCLKLTKMELNNGLRRIGASSFEGDEKLIKLKIPCGVETLGDWSFFYKDACIEIPLTVTSIGRHVFGEGVSLSFVGAPPKWLTAEWVQESSVRSIDYHAKSAEWQDVVIRLKDICDIREVSK